MIAILEKSVEVTEIDSIFVSLIFMLETFRRLFLKPVPYHNDNPVVFTTGGRIDPGESTPEVHVWRSKPLITVECEMLPMFHSTFPCVAASCRALRHESKELLLRFGLETRLLAGFSRWWKKAYQAQHFEGLSSHPYATLSSFSLPSRL